MDTIQKKKMFIELIMVKFYVLKLIPISVKTEKEKNI
jgi:hypothetical protein